ncbi:MAG: LysM peptidoglycan-binding domain-containing protein [Candidatus Limivicinus sp.]
MKIYRVRPGESLKSIAGKFALDHRTLAELNSLTGTAQPAPGTALLIPDENAGGTEPGELFALFPSPDTLSPCREILPLAAYFSPGPCRIGLDGGLLPGPCMQAGPFTSPLPLHILTLTNLDYSGGFSREAIHGLLNEEEKQARFFSSLSDVLSPGTVHGINFDFQYILPCDREAYNKFLSTAAGLLRPRGLLMFSSIPPQEQGGENMLNSWADCAFHGRLMDRVILLGQWGHSRSSPQAAAPGDRLEAAIEAAADKIAPSKLLLSLSCVGYDWLLPWNPEGKAKLFSSSAALDLAACTASEIRRSAPGEPAFFNYGDTLGGRHGVWFEDAESLRKKLRLVKKYDLAGICIYGGRRPFRPCAEIFKSLFSAVRLN